MPRNKQFTEYHVRPGIYYWSPKANEEREEVNSRRKAAEDHRQRSIAFIEEGSYSEAEHQLQIAVASWPDNPFYLLELGKCIAFIRSDPHRSLAWFDECLTLKASAGHYRARALARLKGGLLRESLEDFETALQVKPDDMTLTRMCAMNYHALALFPEAIRDYTSSLESSKNAAPGSDFPTFEVLMNRGNCQRLVGNMEEAFTDLDAACTLALTNVPCRLSLGAVLVEQKNFHRAKDIFRVCIEIDRTNPASLNNLALAVYFDITEPKPERFAGLQPPLLEDETEVDPEADIPSDDDDLEDIDFEAAAKNPVKSPQADLSKSSAGSNDLDLSPKETAELQEGVQALTDAMGAYGAYTADRDARIEAARTEGPKPKLELQVIREDEAYDGRGGVLHVLENKPRTPGFPVVHAEELQAGELLFNRGRLRLVLGHLQAADGDFQKALEANRGHPHFPHFKGRVFEEKGDCESAVKMYNRALEMRRSYYPSLFHSGLALRKLGRQEEAIDRLDAALAERPRAWQTMEARGVVLQDLDRHHEAILALRDAVRHLDAAVGQSVHARLHLEIAQSALATYNASLCNESLDKSEAAGQDLGLILNLKGLLARSQGHTKPALAFLTSAIRRTPSDARLLFDRSQCFLAMRKHKRALCDLRHGLTLLPRNPTLLYHIAQTHLAAGQQHLAQDALETAAEIIGTGKFVFDAELWIGMKFLTNIARPPNFSGELWYRLGCIRATIKKYESACAAFERAVEMLPSHPAFLHELAKSQQCVGRYDEAIVNFNKVLMVQKENARAIFRRGLAHHSLGEYARAAEDMLHARKLEPHNPQFRVDFHRLGNVTVIELCNPGEEMGG